MKSARMSFWNFRNIIVKTVRANCITGKTEKYQLNLWRANEIVMEEANLAGKTSFDPVVYYAQSELLYSPCLKGKRGNLAAFLGLKRSEYVYETDDQHNGLCV